MSEQEAERTQVIRTLLTNNVRGPQRLLEENHRDDGTGCGEKIYIHVNVTDNQDTLQSSSRYSILYCTFRKYSDIFDLHHHILLEISLWHKYSHTCLYHKGCISQHFPGAQRPPLFWNEKPVYRRMCVFLNRAHQLNVPQVDTSGGVKTSNHFSFFNKSKILSLLDGIGKLLFNNFSMRLQKNKIWSHLKAF